MITKYLKQFEKYANGEMSPEEIVSFEQHLKEDPAMEGAFREYQQIMEALKDSETLGLRAKLKEIREEEMKSGMKNRFIDRNNNLIWLAALLAIVVSFTVIISLMIRNFASEEEILATAPNEMEAIANLNAELMKYAMRTHGLTLEMPSDTTSFYVKGDIFFKWSVDSTYNLLMDVIDQDGRVVYKSHRPIESPYIFKKKLRPGIYIFRFRNDKETFKLTYFFVR